MRKIQSEIGTHENALLIDDLKDWEGNRYTPTNSGLKMLKYKIINLLKEKFKHKIRTFSLNHIVHNKVYDLIIVSDYRVRNHINHFDILIRIEAEEKLRMERIQTRDGVNVTYPKKYIYSKHTRTNNFYTILNNE